jgi:hypothetical protein
VRQVNAVLGVYARSTIVVESTVPVYGQVRQVNVMESTVPVYYQVRQVNAVQGVYARSTIVIESTVPVYCQVRQVNAVIGVYAKSTIVVESTVPVYCQVCQVTRCKACTPGQLSRFQELTVPVYCQVRQVIAVLGVYAKSTIVTESTVYCHVCQVNARFTVQVRQVNAGLCMYTYETIAYD